MKMFYFLKCATSKCYNHGFHYIFLDSTVVD